MTTAPDIRPSVGLRRCPTCAGKWPNGEAFELRSFKWLGILQRGVTPSNTDWMGWIHDGANGRNRFLVLEAKGPREPLSPGQERFLCGLAALPGFTVRVLRGTTEYMRVYRVTRDAVQREPVFIGFASTYQENLYRWMDGAQAA